MGKKKKKTSEGARAEEWGGGGGGGLASSKCPFKSRPVLWFEFFGDLAGLGLLGEAPSMRAVFVGFKDLEVSSTQVL